ncbi:hypothetical protein [Lentilactobacillus rapi]|uniref:hypothetical protein n=1 Tax=Lentilactobacillus rapi TaxID=481723 RepID=UPI0006D10608|nr:hypothetical protein [Lentilactobacillus rapi]
MIEDSKSSGGEQILVAIILFIFQMFISAFVSDASLVSNGTIQLIYSIFVLFETWHLLGTGRIFKKNIVANKKNDSLCFDDNLWVSGVHLSSGSSFSLCTFF